MNSKVGRLEVAAERVRIPYFWSSIARQEVGKGKGVDNLFLQGEVLQGETCEGFSSRSYHAGVKLYYWSGIFIHTFKIKCNLILISNPIMAYAYQKQRKT